MDPNDRLFGELAVRLRLLTRAEVSQCLTAQKEQPGQPIGAVACGLGLMTDADRQHVLAQQRKILERRQQTQPVNPPAEPQARAPVAQPEARASLSLQAQAPVVVSATATPPGAWQAQVVVDPAAASLPEAQPSSAARSTPHMRAVQPRTSVAATEPEPTPMPARAPVPRTSQPAMDTAEPEPPSPKVQGARPGGTQPLAETYLGKALQIAVAQAASDLHVHSGAALMMRVDGQLRPVTRGGALSAEAAKKVMAEVMTDAQWARLARHGEVDFALRIPGGARCRVNAYRQQRGLDMVLRIIPPRPPSLEELGLPERLARLADFRTGMVLFTGPTGCGKSTSLAALVNLLVQTRSEHVLTIEDPVEFVFPPGPCLVNQRQVGDHTGSFARALRAALREDPDIIVITELRDRETMALAISAAETGHLVLGTLHTGNAPLTINRIVSSFAAEEQEQIRAMLAESLRAVVSQRLVPRAEGKGRAVAVEVLMVNTAVSNLIREDKTFQLPSVMQTGKAQGMTTLDDSLAELVRAGEISREQALKVADKKERFA